MHRLTGGRFTLGLGRGIDAIFSAYGIPKVTTAQMEDIAGSCAACGAGEVIFGHDGPAGKYPILHLDASFDEDIPLGPRRLRPEHAGPRRPRVRHGRAPHVLHRRDDDARGRGRPASRPRQAGRDPAAVRIWSCYATVPDTIPDDLRLKKTVGRLATYLQGYGDLLVAHERLGPRRARPLPSRRGGRLGARCHRRRGRHADARAHRHAAARRVAGAGGDRHARRLRGAGPPAVRPRRRRRDHARRHAGRAGARRRGLPSARGRPAASTTSPPTLGCRSARSSG